MYFPAIHERFIQKSIHGSAENQFAVQLSVYPSV